MRLFDTALAALLVQRSKTSAECRQCHSHFEAKMQKSLMKGQVAEVQMAVKRSNRQILTFGALLFVPVAVAWATNSEIVRMWCALTLLVVLGRYFLAWAALPFAKRLFHFLRNVRHRYTPPKQDDDEASPVVKRKMTLEGVLLIYAIIAMPLVLAGDLAGGEWARLTGFLAGVPALLLFGGALLCAFGLFFTLIA